jgi:hypothetical protein
VFSQQKIPMTQSVANHLRARSQSRTGAPVQQQSFVVVELVDLELLSNSDKTECFFELRWGSGVTVRSSTQKPHNGIVTFCERMRAPVPHLGARRQSMELPLFAAYPTEIALAWCQVPVVDILAGKRLRNAVHLKAPGSTTDSTAYVLQVAYFYAEDASDVLRPSEVPLSDNAGNPIFSSGPGGRGGLTASDMRLRGGGSGAGASQFGSDGRSSAGRLTAGHDASTDGRNNASDGFYQSNPSLVLSEKILAQLNNKPKITTGTQTDLSGEVVSATSIAALQKQLDTLLGNNNNNNNASPVSGGRSGSSILSPFGNNNNNNNSRSVSISAGTRHHMDDRAASEIKNGFDNFYEKDVANREREKTIAQEIAAQASANANMGHLPLQNPVDLLAMKRSVAAWPRDEVEGLITYGQQMKRYADTLEKQNARLVIHQMKDAVAELKDLGNNLNRSASGALSFNSPNSRSSSIGQQQQQHHNRSSVSSQFTQNVLGLSAAANNNNPDESGVVVENIYTFEDVNGYYSPSARRRGITTTTPNNNNNRSPSTSATNRFVAVPNPEFVTRIEMNRGLPLEDDDRDHILNHFGEL